MPKQTYSIELEERQYQFLEQMVNDYSLPDVGKAVRCLIDYVVSEPRQQSTIWEEIRCLDC
jgi:hypothetical protein